MGAGCEGAGPIGLVGGAVEEGDEGNGKEGAEEHGGEGHADLVGGEGVGRFEEESVCHCGFTVSIFLLLSRHCGGLLKGY